MSSLTQQLNAYKREHTNHTNVLLHYIGIPALMIGLLILLSWVQITIGGQYHISFAWIAVAALLAYYYFLDVKLAAAMTVALVIVTLFCTWIAFPAPSKFSFVLFIALVVGGALCQYIGHGAERNVSNFTKNISQLLIGPMFVLVALIHMLNLNSFFNLDNHHDSHNENPHG